MYTQRYYASYDKQKGHVTGWFDIKGMSHTNNVPPESELIKLTDEEWETRSLINHSVVKGKLVLKDQTIDVVHQAKTCLHEVREHITHEYVMLNEPVPDKLVEYQKKLKRVIAGELKKLPKKPY